MKKLYSVLIALGVMVLLASEASAAAAKKPAFPSWSQQINTPKRFTVLTAFGSAAVLDNETGLVWEQSPSLTLFTWFEAQSFCNASTVGNRIGWRVPTLQELASLIDPNNPSGNPDLPPGHPFTNVQSSFYWSATTLATDTTAARVANFDLGGVGFGGKTLNVFVWCVRGGQGVDPQ